MKPNPSEDLKNTTPEIVAPAGNEYSFWAAVAAGADAVYLGLKEFNARRRAENFDLNELPWVIKEAHLRNVKVYVTLNIILKNTELLRALENAEKVLEAGADALILQDLGFAEMLIKTFPDARLHASTQINAHNTSTVEALTKLGFKRIVLARELSLQEMREIIERTGAETEVFVHGALCYSYSGQCLFSSIVGRRSGNRGLCAQPCRLPYEFVARTNGSKVLLKTPYNYLLSTKDLLGIYHLYHLIKAGVKALKIEGRLKSPEYVSLTTQVYKRELRRALELKTSYVPLKESVEVLEEAFSRGFSPAYLVGNRGNAMMSYTRPNNRGIFIGRVSYVDAIGGRVGVALRRSISIGDVLEFWTSKKGRVVQKVKELFNDSGPAEEVEAGRRAHIHVENDRHLIKPGDRVYRVVNAKLLSAALQGLKESLAGGIPLKFKVTVTEDGSARMEAEAEGQKVVLSEKIEVEKAQKAETTPDIVRNQLSKLGGTPYTAADINVEMPEGIHIRLKEINALRRMVVEAINEMRLKPWEKQVKPSLGVDFWRKKLEGSARRQIFTPVFAVKVRDLEYFNLALKKNPDVIFVRYPFFRKSGLSGRDDLNRLIASALEKGMAFGLAFPQVMKDSEIEEALSLVEEYRQTVSYVLADNLGFALKAVERRFPVWVDYHLNTFNTLAAELLADLGIRFIVLSAELSIDEIKKTVIAGSFNAGIMIAGDIELMAAEHCPLIALSGAENLEEIQTHEVQPCVLLAREKQLYPRFCELASFYLKDRAGYEFPVRSDMACRGYIYNSRFLCGLEYLVELYQAGIGLFVVDLAGTGLLKKEEIEKLLDVFRRAVDLMKQGKKPVLSSAQVCGSLFTRGDFEREVL